MLIISSPPPTLYTALRSVDSVRCAPLLLNIHTHLCVSDQGVCVHSSRNHSHGMASRMAQGTSRLMVFRTRASLGCFLCVIIGLSMVSILSLSATFQRNTVQLHSSTVGTVAQGGFFSKARPDLNERKPHPDPARPRVLTVASRCLFLCSSFPRS